MFIKSLISIWLYIPEPLHRLLFLFLFHLWFLLRPKYRKRITTRLNHFDPSENQNTDLRLSPKKIYWNLYLNLWQSYRFIFKVKTPQVIIEGELLGSKTLFWSLHWGAFEALHPILAEQIPLTVPVASNHSALNNWRANRGQKILHMHQLKALLTGLKQGENFALLIDQNPGPNHTEFDLSPHLKMKIWKHFIERAHQMGYQICAFWCEVQRINRQYQLILKIDPAYDPQKKELGSLSLTEFLAENCRKKIRRQPEQWVWHYGKSPLIKN